MPDYKKAFEILTKPNFIRVYRFGGEYSFLKVVPKDDKHIYELTNEEFEILMECLEELKQDVKD